MKFKIMRSYGQSEVIEASELEFKDNWVVFLKRNPKTNLLTTPAFICAYSVHAIVKIEVIDETNKL